MSTTSSSTIAGSTRGAVVSTSPSSSSSVTETLGVERSVCFAKQIASGGEYLHGLNITHRDIKPDNLLLSTAGEIKIGDLGLAKVLAESGTLTMCGTPSYMAPEIFSGHYHAGADVYAFGIVLWQMLHGRRPHPKGWGMAQTLAEVLHKNYRPKIDPQLCPEGLAKLCQECWGNENRPTFADVLQTLHRLYPEEDEEDGGSGIGPAVSPSSQEEVVVTIEEPAPRS